MGVIRVIRESNLGDVSSGKNNKVYPITTAEAVYIPKVGKLADHVHPRIILTKEEMEELIKNDGPYKEGYDYVVYEDDDEIITD